jgi:hypothetical protein
MFVNPAEAGALGENPQPLNTELAGTGVAVGGTGVGVGGTGVGVTVGGTDVAVAVGGTGVGVAVGGTGVAVGGTGVAVGEGIPTNVKRNCWLIEPATKTSVFKDINPFEYPGRYI